MPPSPLTIPDPVEIDGRKYYPAEAVREYFVNKNDLRERLEAKDAKYSEASTLALQAQAALKAAEDRAKALEAQAKDADALRAEIRSARDAAALARVGVPETALPFLRLAHEQALAAVPEAERPADADAAFREWLAAENGARTSLLGHLFAQPPAPAAAPAAPVPAPAQPPAQASAATPAPTPPRPSVMPPSVVGGAPVPPTPALDVGRLVSERQSLASSYARAPASERPAIRAKVEALDAQIASVAPSAAR
jgi:hypothetical protein